MVYVFSLMHRGHVARCHLLLGAFIVPAGNSRRTLVLLPRVRVPRGGADPRMERQAGAVLDLEKLRLVQVDFPVPIKAHDRHSNRGRRRDLVSRCTRCCHVYSTLLMVLYG